MNTFVDEIPNGFLVVEYSLDEAPRTERQVGVIPFSFDHMGFFITQNPHNKADWVCVDRLLCDSMREQYEQKIVTDLVGDLREYAIDAADYAYSTSRENW